MGEKKRNRKRLYSIKKLQLAMIFLFIVPILTLQLVQNAYSLQEFHSEMEQNGEGTIYLYQRQLESDIGRIETSISGYWAQDYSHGRLLYRQSELNAYRYSYDVITEYKALMSSEPTIAAMLILSNENRILKGTFAEATTTYEERTAMWEYGAGLLKQWEEDFPKSWFPLSMGGRCFLVRFFGNRSARTLCFIDLDQTVKPQDAPHFPEDSLMLYADQEGNPLTSQALLADHGIFLKTEARSSYFSGRHFIVQNYSAVTGMYIVFLEAYPGGLHKMNQILILILFLSAFILALVPMLFLALKRWYLKPMEHMTETLKKIRSGKLDARFREEQKVEELQQLSTSFNEMMDEVKNLKIETYEKEIQVQYAELQYLQLQISPHFFLNILKTLYGMAEGKKYDKIQNAILMISDHVRYIFHDNKDRVLLDTELKHAESYIRMQQYITSHPIRLNIRAGEEVREAMIPALSIQTFVENSCKHALVPGKELVISLDVQPLDSERGRLLDISVSDNGPGIPPELLKEYNGRVTFEHREEHIGILNVRQRLYLLYGGQFEFACMEGNPGTIFEMVFPLDKIHGDGNAPAENCVQRRRICDENINC